MLIKANRGKFVTGVQNRRASGGLKSDKDCV